MSDIDDMRKALEALEQQTFTAHEVGVIQGLMASWDQVDSIDDNAEALLRDTFKNDFMKAGALTQVIMLAEKNAQNPQVDAQLKGMIEESMGKWKVDSGPRAKMK
tara:strand:- start:95511 stop:95825 length:315 start_codon:yes stop_codon:yes gene_type:complete